VVRRLAASGSLPEEVRAVDYGIRGMHLAYDLLAGYDALLIVDALPGGGAPGTVRAIEVGEADLRPGGFDPHGMTPVAVLSTVAGLVGTLPATVVVGCTPLDVGHRIGLSAPVEAALPEAMATVRAVLQRLIPALITNGAD
jgi:hydrogenase maturation protease